MRYLLILLGLLFITGGAATDSGISVTELVRGSSSWNGENFQYLDGKPEITVKKLVVTPQDGEKIILAEHCHPTPAAAYILRGRVTVTDSFGSKRTFGQGDAIVEIMNIWHKGVFSEHTELIVFYAGAVDVPLSVKKGSDSIFAEKCF